MNNTTPLKKRPSYAPEVRQRAVRMVLDHQGDYPSRWGAIASVAQKIGCAPQSLHEWVRKTEVDSGKRVGVTTETTEKMKALEREVRELRQANEILRKASAYFAPLSRFASKPLPGKEAELDRPFKR
jgi:transposase